MTVSTWYADVEFLCRGAMPDDAEFDVLEVMSAYNAVLSISRDRLRGAISLAIDAVGAHEAAISLGPALRPVEGIVGNLEITKMDIMDENSRDAEVGEATFPELVGYAEIADMAHISRQRARQIASRSDFPVPVVETAAGPLRVKAAVEKWLSSWDRTPGRPRRISSMA